MRPSFLRRLYGYPKPSLGQSGLVRGQAAQADTAGAATLATLIADHNALLAKLRLAGIIA